MDNPEKIMSARGRDMSESNEDALTVLRRLTLPEVEQRIADLDAERAALSLIRRSLAARERAKRRASRPVGKTKEGGT